MKLQLPQVQPPTPVESQEGLKQRKKRVAVAEEAAEAVESQEGLKPPRICKRLVEIHDRALNLKKG